ncbi:phenylacetaldehyde dehydrogenase [Propionibacteriaceae bacterium ES.041]|uniref:aldehyde dehydrogenase family protein n=1 Tax=Enemella evansiae TaxID=2016499 RepID=UPI000B970993|nr:aldehyde dehydrogenase family protein [Enemella evansiae]OYO12086.1 aldehyde dehydrogenase [Enemella evansiae]PFG69187.1 phenylacetaldehyde dehydrogenase [Propionibacteriaceae bacterium ES.041]TDO89468.1 phenylacetaldehyde dehydrogenase [Enemella evansiae]
METYESLLAAVSVEDGEPITNPATDEVVGRAPQATADDLTRAVAAAEKAQPGWAALGHERRSQLLNEAADAVDRSAEALAELIAREQGKPLNGPGARFEAGGVAAWLRAAAATPLEPEQVLDDETGRATLSYRPIGVVGAIGPWNWPALIASWQFAPALRMGNTVVLKPSEYTPLSVLALGAIVNQVLPEGVLQVLSGGRDLGAAMTNQPGFGKLMFTGSTATGRAIVAESAEQLPRLTLELGGNDPGIVLPDVDPEAIAEDLFWGAFINTGQTCAALKRLYVHEDVYDAVVAALTAVAEKMAMGPGTDEQNVLGPLTTPQQFTIVDRLVEQAKASGARIVLGGEPDRDAPGNFYPATLVADIDPDQPLVIEEQFGPALPIIRYRDLDEVIGLANALDAGLGASVWSSDPGAAREIATRIQSGTVWINSHGGVHPMVPFGGVKGSGYGLEFGVEGLKAVAVPQVING